MATKEERGENAAISDLVRGLVREQIEFCYADLTDDLIRQGLWGAVERMSRLQFRVFRRGAMEDVTRIIKAWHDNEGKRMSYALEDGPKARWKLWAKMDRYESRLAYLLLKKKHGEQGLELKEFRKMHKERFDEDPDDFEEVG